MSNRYFKWYKAEYLIEQGKGSSFAKIINGKSFYFYIPKQKWIEYDRYPIICDAGWIEITENELFLEML